MDSKLAALKQSISRLPRNGRQRRLYPPETRAQILSLVDRAQAQGLSIQGVGRSLDVPLTTICKWMTLRRKANRPASPRLRPVQVSAAAAPTPELRRGVVVVTPGGYRIEGLAANEVAAVLRALS